MMGGRLRFVYRRVLAVLGLVVYVVSVLVPAREGVWVFGADGGDRFAGNPKYLFLYVAAEHGDVVRPVWVSADDGVVEALSAAGYEAYRCDSWRGRWVTARAEYVFTSHDVGDVAKWFTGGVDVVQLWHGVPLKRIGADVDRGWGMMARVFFRLFTACSAWVVTGENHADVIAGAYPVEASAVWGVGYPRNDALIRGFEGESITAAGSGTALVPGELPGQVVAYVPTWRHGFRERHGRPLADADIDFAAVNAVLERCDATMVVKLHPSAESDLAVEDHDRIVACPSDVDINRLLRDVDVLVTDYSSVYFDYLYLDRPIVFFPYDREAYEADPGLYYEYDAVTPGPVAESGEAFVYALEATLRGGDGYGGERERVRNRFFDAVDDQACERIYAALRR